MIIAVDFDGTCVTHEYPKVGNDIGAAPVLRELVEAGHKLILLTMRCDTERPIEGNGNEIKTVQAGTYLADAIEWFRKNEIALYAVNENPEQKKWTASPKVFAHMYIDDAALGIPLKEPLYARPHVDWMRVQTLLIHRGVLPIRR